MSVTITWPATVPWAAQAEGYSETPQRVASTFTPDAGAPIERRRLSTSMIDMSYTLMAMDNDAFEDFLTFFRDTTKAGTLPFNTTHPRTGDSIIARFTSAPSIAVVEGIYYKISVQITVL